MPPTRANGKICYLEMPAIDVGRSAEFYSQTFGWQIRRRGDGATAWSVDSVAAPCQAVVAHGGTIVQPIGADAPEITARFRDPGGNIIGLYQEPAGSGPTGLAVGAG